MLSWERRCSVSLVVGLLHSSRNRQAASMPVRVSDSRFRISSQHFTSETTASTQSFDSSPNHRAAQICKIGFYVLLPLNQLLKTDARVIEMWLHGLARRDGCSH